MSTNKLTKYTSRTYPEKVGKRNFTPLYFPIAKTNTLNGKSPTSMNERYNGRSKAVKTPVKDIPGYIIN
jgi:hypothetical protein